MRRQIGDELFECVWPFCVIGASGVKIFHLVLLICFYLLILIFMMLSWEELWLTHSIFTIIHYWLCNYKSLNHSEIAKKILNIVLIFLADVRDGRIDSFLCWFLHRLKWFFNLYRYCKYSIWRGHLERKIESNLSV